LTPGQEIEGDGEAIVEDAGIIEPTSVEIPGKVDVVAIVDTVDEGCSSDANTAACMPFPGVVFEKSTLK
jgi:hypothetical protein